jgi:hypothetical protein
MNGTMTLVLDSPSWSRSPFESDLSWIAAERAMTGLRAGVCAACQNRKSDQQGTRSYPRRRSAVSIATSTREVMPGTSTGRRPAT